MLSERRKADRMMMAEGVRALAERYGLEAVVKDKPYGDTMYPQRIDCRLRHARGLCLTVDFDGKSCQPDVHVLSWHMNSDAGAVWLNPSMWGSINLFHFHKATDIAHGYEDLLAVLELRFGRLKSGDAYCDAKPVRRAA